MANEWICLITAAVVWGGAFLLAGRIARKQVSEADRDAEAKGYFRKHDTPPTRPQSSTPGSDPPAAA